MTEGERIEIREDSVFRLPRGVRVRHDSTRGQDVLLAPERAVALDDIALKIVEALDGERALGGIIDDFASQFAAPREQIANDVAGFLRQLAERRMLEIV